MYSLKYKVTTSTCDSEGRLKLYSALQMMQDCSEMWIDSEPEVKDYFFYKTWSMGAFVDKVAGKLKRVDDATIQSMTLEPQLEMNYKDRRIILPKTEGEVLHPIKVLRADIDYNKHLNNANYVRMAMELLPENFVVNGLRVEYRVAAKLGDCLTPTIFKIADGIIVSLSIGSEVSAIIEFT